MDESLFLDFLLLNGLWGIHSDWGQQKRIRLGVGKEDHECILNIMSLQCL